MNGMKRAHYDISAGPASPHEHDHVSLMDSSDGAAGRRVPKVSKKIQACMYPAPASLRNSNSL
jgi:hypothetical protein